MWGCGCTYETSASFRDAEHGTREGMYAHVYREARPEVFFKGTARVCVGRGEPIGIRPDSIFTAPEPELAVVLGPGHSIFGFTLANDVSAWDIERENALYLTQSKVYDRCCALGPVIVTADEIPDPYRLQMTCTVTRGGERALSWRGQHRQTPSPAGNAGGIPDPRQPRSHRHGAAHRHRHHRATQKPRSPPAT